MDLLRDAPPGNDPVFMLLRDEPRHEPARAFVRLLWRRHGRYADRHFMQEFSNDMYSRFWEMYLACAFLDAGFEITSADEGPDFFALGVDRRIAVEAIAPNPDAALAWTPPDPSVATRLPEDEIVRRYTWAVLDKWKKLNSVS